MLTKFVFVFIDYQMSNTINMKKVLFVFGLAALMAACSSGDKPKLANAGGGNAGGSDAIAAGRGIGEVKEVELKTPLEQDRIGRGKAIYDMKCSACHKLTADKFVGPGWKDVTHRRKPEWIINMVTNVEVMLEKDPEAQKLLQLCLTRMPNQNVSLGDARDVLEFMRQNDGEK